MGIAASAVGPKAELLGVATSLARTELVGAPMGVEKLVDLSTAISYKKDVLRAINPLSVEMNFYSTLQSISALNRFLAALRTLPDNLDLKSLKEDDLSKAKKIYLDRIATDLEEKIGKEIAQAVYLLETKDSTDGFKFFVDWFGENFSNKSGRVIDVVQSLKDKHLPLIKNVDFYNKQVVSQKNSWQAERLFNQLQQTAKYFGEDELANRYSELEDSFRKKTLEKETEKLKIEKRELAGSVRFFQGSMEGEYNVFYFKLPKDVAGQDPVRFSENFVFNEDLYLGSNKTSKESENKDWYIEAVGNDSDLFKLNIDDHSLLERFRSQFAKQII